METIERTNEIDLTTLAAHEQDFVKYCEIMQAIAQETDKPNKI